MPPLKIIHTSDWHLGQNLFNQERKEEHKQFLDWLLQTIDDQKVDALIISGDIFDNGTPPNYAEELYYQFLARLLPLKVQVFITAGNHDSVSTLEAPKTILSALNIKVTASIEIDKIAENIFPIFDNEGNEKALICNIPYLRERDVRKSFPGESHEERSQKYLTGVTQIYKKFNDEANKITKELPTIATGHLFVAGGEISESVADHYVGTLGYIPTRSIEFDFDYIAMGHLHKPQKLNNKVIYSGSPIPLSFSESTYQKTIQLLEISKGQLTHKAIDVPQFHNLLVIKGDGEEILDKVKKCIDSQKEYCIEIQITTTTDVITLKNELYNLMENSNSKILRIINKIEYNPSLSESRHSNKTLDQFEVKDIFIERLKEEELSENSKKELESAFDELYREVISNGEDK